jgi:hypothetical protein
VFAESQPREGVNSDLTEGLFYRSPRRDVFTQPKIHSGSAARGSFDDLVSGNEQSLWKRETERLGGLDVDSQLELGRDLHGKFARLRAMKDAINVLRCAPK